MPTQNRAPTSIGRAVRTILPPGLARSTSSAPTMAARKTSSTFIPGSMTRGLEAPAPPRSPELGAIPVELTGNELADVLDAVLASVERTRQDEQHYTRSGDQERLEQAAGQKARLETLLVKFAKATALARR